MKFTNLMWERFSVLQNKCRLWLYISKILTFMSGSLDAHYLFNGSQFQLNLVHSENQIPATVRVISAP